MKTTGRCLCRAVAFEFEGEPKWVLNCHCEDCRRATSAPMATWLSVVGKNGLRFTGEAPRHFSSSPGVRRGFCGRCGSPLTYEHEQMPGEVHLLAASLDDSGSLAQPTHRGPRKNRTGG